MNHNSGVTVLQPGDRLGEYSIKKVLKKGGMGLVYLAKKGNREVVIKSVVPTGPPSERRYFMEKLRVESSILKKLEHPNIVRYIDFFEEKGSSFLVLEYIKGDTLERLYAGRPLKEKKVKNIILPVLSAIRYLHQRNFIHRDLKPSNIMLSKDRITLIDFGTCVEGYTGTHTVQRTQVGTLGYSAPEQMQTGLVTPQGDIFSLGAVLYFLLTGHHSKSPFGNLSPKSLKEDISDTMDEIVRKATHKNWTERYQTVDDFISAIQGLVTREADEARVLVNGKVYPITEEFTTIGSSLTSDGEVKIPVNESGPERYISRVHAVIKMEEDGEFKIYDGLPGRPSTNGIWFFKPSKVEGCDGEWERLPPGGSAYLRDGDVIALAYDKEKGPYTQIIFRCG